MAVATPQAVASAQEWDEAEFEAGLARLKELHIQLRNLRTTIPRIIQPFVANHSSPEDLYDDFSKAAVTAATEIQDFRKDFEDRKTMLIFTNGSLSRRVNPERISTWRVTEHPDWLDRDEGGQGEKDDVVGEVEDELDDGEEEQDIGRIVEAFTTSYQELKVQYNEGYIFKSSYQPILKAKQASKSLAQKRDFSMWLSSSALPQGRDRMTSVTSWYPIITSVAQDMR
ncbi:MAG: hypothetical protein M1835_005366 [Candelina submexicana]|nr:MAG: hypothetical protein M1835_005366 [Candelina submexicana]